MTLQTVAAMRDFLSLGLDVSDEYAIELYGAYLAQQSSAPVLTLGEVKKNLRVDQDDEDDLIAGLIIAAQEHVEDYTGLILTPRTITETVPVLGRMIDLASWPISAVTEIRYPSLSDMVALPGTSWVAALRRRPVRIRPVATFWGLNALDTYDRPEWSSRGVAPLQPVEIDVQAGYATPADVPATIKQAMHLLIAHFYTNRSAVESGARAAAVELPLGVEALLRRHRLELV